MAINNFQLLIGKMLSSALRCMAHGGLSITKTSNEIEKRLTERNE